jgi:hypothetical protein
MDGEQTVSSDLATMAVPQVGQLVATGDPFDPYQLLDSDGAAVEGVAIFLRDLDAAGQPAFTGSRRLGPKRATSVAGCR